MLIWLVLHFLLGLNSVWMESVNLVTLFVILIGCFGAAATSIAVSPVRLWFPITWFLLTAAVYYGFGPMLYYFGTAETIDYSDAYYYVEVDQLYRANMLNLTGIVSVMSAYLASQRLMKISSSKLVTDYRSEEMRRALWRISIIFVSIGLPVKFLLVMPRSLAISSAVVPGSIAMFATFSTLALVPLFILYRFNRSNYALPFYTLLFLEGVSAFIQLSKLEVLKIVILLLMGAVLTGTRFKRIVIIGLISAGVYGLVLTPLITLSRINYSSTGLTSVADTQSALQDYASNGREDAADLMGGVESWWSRLNYANAQSFAMDAYDQGLPGDTFALALYAFVPRIVYPDKPLMNSGADFNMLVNDNPDSQSSPGMFAEAYWNGGWLFALFTFIFMGVLYWVLEMYTYDKLERSKLVYLPVVWIGLFSAIQQDSWFIPVAVGSISQMLALHYILKLFSDKHSNMQKDP